MKFEVEVEKLIQLNLDFTSYCVLQTIYNSKDSQLLLKYSTDIQSIRSTIDNLVSKGYIINESGYKFSGLKITNKYIQDFTKVVIVPKVSPVSEWIDIFFNLFPKGIKSGGFYVRSDKQGCIKKMESFMKQYPEYTKGIIITATKKYVDGMKNNNYNFCKMAPYFISKDGISMLEGFCQDVLKNVNTPDEDNTKGKTQLGIDKF